MCNSHKEERVGDEKLFQNWITIFGNPDKFLVDNGGEYCNEEYTITFCENLQFVFA